MTSCLRSETGGPSSISSVQVASGSRLDQVASIGFGDFIGLDSSGRRVTPAFPPPTFRFDPATDSLTLALRTTATASHGWIYLHHHAVGLGTCVLVVSMRPSSQTWRRSRTEHQHDHSAETIATVARFGSNGERLVEPYTRDVANMARPLGTTKRTLACDAGRRARTSGPPSCGLCFSLGESGAP